MRYTLHVTRYMVLKIFTDGGSKGNPGPSAIGMVFYIEDKQVYTYREDIGVTTNNVAEYTAVIIAMSKVPSIILRTSSSLKSKVGNIDKIEFYSDSTLLVNQLNGLFKIKNPRIRTLVLNVKTLEMELGIPVSYTHVKRERNTIADALVNNTML